MGLNLNKGILFEDSGVLLEWGKPIRKLIKKNNGRTENKEDRTIYHWGSHKILNGLDLDLTNHFWNFGKEAWFRKFKKIEFWAYGDNEAISNFERISKHITEQFGEPNFRKEPDKEPERNWRWELNGVDISLYFFEQHAYKLHMTIKKI